MDAIVIAGGNPTEDHPLFKYSQGKPKALIDIKGKPMIVWVLQALAACSQIDELVVVGIDELQHREMIESAVDTPIKWLPDAGGLVQNGLAGLELVYAKNGSHSTVIGCSSDIPHIEPHMVKDLIERCQPHDKILYYAAVTPEVIDTVYPKANRTFANLGGVKLAGCDIFVSNTRILHTNRELWLKIINARKNPLAMAWTVGIWPLLKLATGLLSVADAAALAGKLLEDGQPIGVVYTPFPQLAMDGDKPNQIEILRNS